MPSFFIFHCRFGRFKPRRNFRRIWIPTAKSQRYFGRTMLKGLRDDAARWAHRPISRLRRSGGPRQIVETRFTTSVDGTDSRRLQIVDASEIGAENDPSLEMRP